jgi:hypothetical protein
MQELTSIRGKNVPVDTRSPLSTGGSGRQSRRLGIGDTGIGKEAG